MAHLFRLSLILTVVGFHIGLPHLAFASSERTHVLDIGSEEFLPMSKEQAADLAFKKLAEVNRAVGVGSSMSQEECAGPEVAVIRDGKSQQVAICMMKPEEKKLAASEPATSRSLWSAPGAGSSSPRKVTWEINTGNDADPAKFGTRVNPTGTPQPGLKLNDDVGRTFHAGGKRRETTEEGYSEVRVDTVSFGKREKVNGEARDSDGRAYMKLLNITSLELEKGTVISSKEGVTDLRIVEGSIEVSTGKAKSLGTALQNWFHDKTKSGPIYNYLDHDKLRATATIKAGMTRVIEGNLAAFHCKLTATGLAGIGTDGKPVLEGRLNTSISTGSLGGRSIDNPWLQLDAYRTHLIKAGDRPTENYGARISTSVPLLGARVKPFIGVSKYDGPLDRKYSAGSRGGHSEEYWEFGIAIEKNF